MSEPKHKTRFYALWATQDTKFGLSYRLPDAKLVQTLPWKTPHREDMAVFKYLTEENVVVMGYKTYLSLDAKPLANRDCYVVTKTKSLLAINATVPSPRLEFVSSIDEAIAKVKEKHQDQDCFFIGGVTLLETLFRDFSEQLDGAYAASISSNWQSAEIPAGATEAVITHFNPERRTSGFPANFISPAYLYGANVTYFKWIKSTLFPTDSLPQHVTKPIVHDLSVYNDIFYQPSEEVARRRKLFSKPKPSANEPIVTTVDDKTVEAIAASINPTVLQQIVSPVRDRGLAGIDPFDVTGVWLESARQPYTMATDDEPKEAKPSPETVVLNNSTFVGAASEIGEMLVVKDAAYGSAFEKTKEILKILFPNGLPVKAFDDGLTIQRILDKICRLAVLSTNPEENKTDERAEDAWKDIAGYSIKALCEQRRRNKGNKVQ